MSEMKWYIVNAHSGYEEKAKKGLEERIRNASKEEDFGEILIPKEDVVELKNGAKKQSSRRFFPGYMFIQMNMTQETWHVVKDTTYISGFVGNGSTPSPVTEEEVKRVTNQMATGAEKPRPKFTFEVGEEVKVVDGPFSNFNGSVEYVDADKGKLKVLVSIFGRPTPVELDYIQVEKAGE
ncbi:MAG: transcription termination/antitermination protein NusG [Bdellovibrionota bacterium]|nr:transcription termination/antitermination protein NusG [Bdellovibrionota bacterium]